MKTTLIPIYYELEKLKTLRQYRNDTELKDELEAVLQALYEKNVPAEVRGHIYQRVAYRNSSLLEP